MHYNLVAVMVNVMNEWYLLLITPFASTCFETLYENAKKYQYYSKEFLIS